ncbi:MAG TPA: hypothetical protein VIJ01_16155 [Candidatus Angelobacter sp.]
MASGPLSSNASTNGDGDSPRPPVTLSKLLYYANLLGARADVKLKPSRQAMRKLTRAEIA